MFALGAKSFKSSPNYTNDYFGIGANVTETCVKMYQQSITGLGGETARVYNGRIELSDAKYTQRPEVIESVFYMWRFTHDEKYRKYGREILNAMDKWIYDSVAYHDLSSENTPVDRMESFFLAETLKYLYLLFSDDDVIPLDKYVFNTEAHPLSIRGKGRRSDPSKWVPIKETSEYTPPVGSIRPPGASNILKPIPQLKSMSVVVSGPEPKIE